MGVLLTSLIIGIITFTILILLDATLAYAVHLKTGDFDWTKFLNFLKKFIAPYVLIWFVFSVVDIGIFWCVSKLGYIVNLGAVNTLAVIVNFVALLIVGALGKEIVQKLNKLGITVVVNKIKNLRSK